MKRIVTLVPTAAVMLDGLVRIVAFVSVSGGNFDEDDEFELVAGSGRMESTGENQIAVKEMMHIAARTKGFSLGFIEFAKLMIFSAIGISNFPFMDSFLIY
jgi:hypothetical protein